MQPASAASPATSLSSSTALRRAAIVLLGSLFVAVCAHLTIPLWFTPVPLTLQTFAVLLIGLLVSPGVAASTLCLYLAEGMCGLPVFSPTGPATFLHLFGPTGGYLLAYPAAAALTAWLCRRLPGTRFIACLSSAAFGSILILLSGAAWLGLLTRQSPAAVFTLAAAPFLPGDILKLIAAAALATGWRRFRRA